MRVITLVPSSAADVPVKVIHPYAHPFLQLPRDRYSTPHGHRHPDPHSIVPPRLTMSLGPVLPPSQPACSQPHVTAVIISAVLFSLQYYPRSSSSTPILAVPRRIWCRRKRKHATFDFFLKP
ncbi:hypothetical protein E1B28_011847 [Marasmius oreades]|uniref:Uncharacterized protein n=1 Tax=Marasmius oreades TaxID=181124 RepID=A0A9P7RUY0_9AGAR|nr:uncharacterized protein E1B28_011847 [Marasmius oreades]KAG7090249.1 hypothetical protein E1B28_011847 [Marasmius oreades]